MKRIQGQGGFGTTDPYDERKKSRDSVIVTLCIFATCIGVIRALPILMKNLA